MEKIDFLIDMAREQADERGRTIEFPFTADQVVRVYTQKRHPDDYGDGLWFQIEDGTVFNCLGLQERAAKTCYAGPVDGADARDLAAYVLHKLQGFTPADYGADSDA